MWAIKKLACTCMSSSNLFLLMCHSVQLLLTVNKFWALTCETHLYTWQIYPSHYCRRRVRPTCQCHLQPLTLFSLLPKFPPLRVMGQRSRRGRALPRVDRRGWALPHADHRVRAPCRVQAAAGERLTAPVAMGELRVACRPPRGQAAAGELHAARAHHRGHYRGRALPITFLMFVMDERRKKRREVEEAVGPTR
jgi:hypothetical protein